jgi:aminoimidazole riboside kinase
LDINVERQFLMKTHLDATRVLGIGDAMVDLFTRASQLPPRGGNIWSSAVELHSGGTTANVASNLAKLGIPSAFAGFVGDDPYGSYLIDEFKKVQVDTSMVEVKKGTYTGIVLAIIDDQGERTFIACAKGAAHVFLSPEYANSLVLEPDLVVHSSGVCLGEEPARTGLLVTLKNVHENGNVLYFDPNLRLEGNFFPEALRTAQLQAISLSDIILIGDEELALIFPGPSMEDGAKKIIASGSELVIVKQGDKGATAFSAEGFDHVAAFKTEVVSTSGAGDSFDAGFIAARMKGASIHDALVYANAVAAIKVGRQGSQSVPSHGEVMDFLTNNYSSIVLH